MEEAKIDFIVENLIAMMPIFHRKLINVVDEGMGSGLSHYHFAILGMLSKRGNLPVSEFSRRLLISKPQMTAMLDRLVEQGLVDRLADEADRRLVLICLTPAGQRVLERSVNSVRTIIAQKLAHLPNPDIELLATSLKNIVDIGAKLE